MFCGKCGGQILEGYDFCTICGTKVNVKARVETAPMDVMKESRKPKKLLISMIAIFVVITLIVGSVVYLKKNLMKGAPFSDKVTWGMSLNEIADILSIEVRVSANRMDAGTISNYEGIKGVNATVHYNFDDANGLCSVTTKIKPSEKVNLTAFELFRKYTAKLTKKYGDYKGVQGDYTWITEKSIIQLSSMGNEGLILTYFDTGIDGLYDKTPWGATPEKLGDIIDEEVKIDNNSYISTSIVNYKGVKGTRAFVNYNFKDEKLSDINILLYNTAASVYTDPELLIEYVDYFSTLYGFYEISGSEYIWNTKKSTIKVKSIEPGILGFSYKSISENAV